MRQSTVKGLCAWSACALTFDKRLRSSFSSSLAKCIRCSAQHKGQRRAGSQANTVAAQV